MSIFSNINTIYASTNIINNTQETKEDILISKISKNYSNKFCYAIGMGISQEGAARLAIMENKQSKFNSSLWIELARSGEKNIQSIDEIKLTDEISNSIISSCGNAIGMKGEKGVNEFKNYFISIRREIEK